MNKDVVPELWEEIKREYGRLIKENRNIKAFLEKLNSGKAEGNDVSKYGNELGNCAAQAFLKYIRADNLPDGKLYWNIAERIVTSMMDEVYGEVNRVASLVQEKDDKANNIHIKPQKAPFPKYRIRDLTDKIVEIYEEEYGNGEV